MPVTQATLALFSQFIARTIGIHFTEERLFELKQKMTSAARDAGSGDLEQHLLWLMSAPLSREQLEELARVLTIGETYFLRDPRSYQVLEEQLIPELVAQRRGADRSLRIWSAGCSSGEEPYTLAIMLSRVIPDLANWNISLVATDINPQALERGRQGIFSKWSFRNAPPWLMDYFTKTPDGRFQIIPRIRAMVRFDYLNLADDGPAQAEGGGTDCLDIIFCRNVMLYFEQAQIKRTMAKFQGALRDGGWLFVGPTEVDQSTMQGFACRRFPGAFILQKGELTKNTDPDTGACLPCDPLPTARGAQEVPALGAHWLRSTTQHAVAAPAARAAEPGAGPEPATARQPAADRLPEVLALYQAGCYQQAADSVRNALDAGPQPADTLALGARAFANIGRFAEAREFCQQALAADRLSAANHYLLSIILEQLGDLSAAAASLKNVLFIDHDYLLAYFALGNLSRQAGDDRESERNFATALRLLEQRDPREVLPEAEGMTAGSLAQLIRGVTKGRSEHAKG
jgi:chemotaxis protein methyltransferase CheR